MLDYNHLSEVFKALSNPIRLKIVAGLCEHECNVGLIQKNLSVPQATVSQHLRILRMTGIVVERREGKKKCYHVCDPLIIKIIDLLKRT